MSYDATGKNLFQILISDELDQDLRLNPTLEANRQSFVRLHPDFTYALFGDTEIRAVIRAHFSADVLAAYDALIPYAYKADLARYCLLHAFGGIYADLSMRLLSRLALPPGKELLCFRDAYANGGSTWAVSNGLIHAAPGRPEMRAAIDMVVENCRNLTYGASFLHPTGPALFGRAIAMVNRGEELEVGDFRNLTGTTHPLSYGYVDGTGRLVCIRIKEEGGDLALLGIRGVNMYDSVWRLRSAYGEPMLFHHSDQRLRLLQGTRDEAGIMITEDMSGCIIFGPYVYAAAGQYVGKYSFGVGFQCAGITLDIVSDNGVVALTEIAHLDQDGSAFIEFTLPRVCATLQVRLSAHPGNSGLCTALEIKRMPRS